MLMGFVAFTHNCLFSMGVLAFSTRLLLYCGTCLLTLTVKGLEVDTTRSLVMSSLQVLVVACGILLYMFANLLFSAVREAYAYNRTDLDTDEANSFASEISFSNIDKLDSSPPHTGVGRDNAIRQSHTLPDAMPSVTHSPPLTREQVHSCGNLDIESMRKNIDLLSRAESPLPVENVNFALESKLESNAAQMDTSPPSQPWVFDNASALQMYIVHVHIIGAVLWFTVTSLDFSHPIFLTFFTTGLFIGVMVTYGNRLDSSEKASKRSFGSTCVHFVYCVLFTIIVATCFLHEQLAVDSTIDMLIYGVVVVSGMVWGVQIPSHRIVPTTHNAFITTVMMSLPILFLLTTLDKLEKLVHVRGLMALYILVVEPALKFVNVYVLILSVRAHRTTEISIILVSVLCMQICYLVYDADNQYELTIAAVVIIAALLLLLIHFARICLSE